MKRFLTGNALLPILTALFLQMPFGSLCAQEGRTDWAGIDPPSIVSVGVNPEKTETIDIVFIALVGTEGADKVRVEMLDPSGKLLESKPAGRSKNAERTMSFTPSSSGSYSFRVIAARNDNPAQKTSKTVTYDFSFPLSSPELRVYNRGNGEMLLRWNPVKEAQKYTVHYKSQDSTTAVSFIVESPAGAASQVLEATIKELTVGKKYDFTVQAFRGPDNSPVSLIAKTVRPAQDREWNFTWFGQSSGSATNTMKMIDADAMVFSLNSCTTLANGQVDLKGGKFTAFHDGISYYYTTIDPDTENFELTATFTVDYINPVADGQEGFGLLAMDSLGAHGVSGVNHYTNSAGIIATKFEGTVAGVKKTSKDTLGARFVSGITREVLALGDSGIAQNAHNDSLAYSYDSSSLVKKGDVYTLSLKKTNTGYHAGIKNEWAAADAITEYILYGPEKLRALDKDHVYVGFAAARGCNVTVTGVSMLITDPKTDPPPQAEPAILVPLLAKVDSPKTFTSSDYPLVFTSNANGKITVQDGNRAELVKEEPVKAGEDFIKKLKLNKGSNDYIITFTPDRSFRPGKGQVMAAYDRELLAYAESYAPVTIYHSVLFHFYAAKALYVSQKGDMMGDGSPEKPLDLDTALFFAKPGQPIILAGGVYNPERSVIIPRGNNGTASERCVMKSAEGERAIFDFSYTNASMIIAGDYWTVDGIDVRNTQGNIKGLQISGNNNIVSNVNTYNCGDTGLQISGSSAEKPDKWPRNNLVVGCTSYNNSDPAQNNADGFAAKLTCGGGNIFRSCIAYSNIDDGWDLFSKIESGPIGAVVIENCVAFRNGSLLDGSGNGDGNGFKLGGDGIAVPHILRNSVAFDNGASGITSNSDPAIILENNTSYGNRQININLYGKGDGSRLFKASNNISMKGASGDMYREMSSLASADNFFWNGANCANSEGIRLSSDIFISTDMSVMIGRRKDGSIDMKGLLVLNNKAPVGIGAVIR